MPEKLSVVSLGTRLGTTMGLKMSFDYIVKVLSCYRDGDCSLFVIV